MKKILSICLTLLILAGGGSLKTEAESSDLELDFSMAFRTPFITSLPTPNPNPVVILYPSFDILSAKLVVKLCGVPTTKNSLSSRSA